MIHWRPVGRASARTFGAVLLGGAVAACSALNGNQGDLWNPILVTGKAYGADGAPFPGARIRMVVVDGSVGELGERAPDVFELEFVAGRDGAFAIHVAPTAELNALAGRNGGNAAFLTTLLDSAGALLDTEVFRRELRNGAWDGDVPIVALSALGS